MQVRVWNDNSYPFKQLFKGEMVAIPPKKFIMMDEEDAVSFKGKYFPPLLDGANNPKPESYKMIRIERTSDANEGESGKFVCHADGTAFDTKEELDEYVKANHADKLGKAKKAGIDSDNEQNLEGYDDVSAGLPKKGKSRA